MQFGLQCLPCIWHGAFDLPYFGVGRPGFTLPFIFYSLCHIAISHLNFTLRMAWCILAPLFYGEASRRHFAVYLLISMPLCNFASEFCSAYDMGRFTFRNLRWGRPTSFCRVCYLASNVYLAYYMVHLIFHILASVDPASLCRLSFIPYATLQLFI